MVDNTTIKQVSLSQLRQRSNYRQAYDQSFLDTLASDMATNGYSAAWPIQAYLDGESYIVIDGNTRYTAALQGSSYDRFTHQPTMQVWIAIVDKPTDAEFIMLQLTGNELRVNPDDISKANGYKQAIDSGIAIDDLARRINHRVDYIQDRLYLLDLVPEAQKLVANGNLGIKYAATMHELDANRQRIALGTLSSGQIKTLDVYQKFCNDQLEKQRNQPLFALFGECEVSAMVDSANQAITAKKLDAAKELEIVRAQLASEKKAREQDRLYARREYAKLKAELALYRPAIQAYIPATQGV